MWTSSPPTPSAGERGGSPGLGALYAHNGITAVPAVMLGIFRYQPMIT